MKSSRRIYISLILAGAVVPFVMASVALAATVPSSSYAGTKMHMAGSAKFTGQKPVAFGKVTSVNGSTITVSDAKTSIVYTVDVSNAKITEGFGTGAQSLGYTSIKVGDEVVIMGTISGSSVTATSVFDGVESHAHAAAPHVIGTVSGISGSSLSVSVQARGTYTVNTTSSTTITKDGKADTFSDIAVGQTVMAVGTIDTATSTVTATKVNIVTRVPQAHVTGAVTGITGTTLTVQSKKGTAYTVDASSASVTTGFGKNAATVPLASIAVGQHVMVVGSHVSGSANIVASSVRMVQPKKA